jgi:hypothetical protein
MVSPNDMPARPASPRHILSQRVLPAMIDAAAGVERGVQIASQSAASRPLMSSALAALAGYVVGRMFCRLRRGDAGLA